MAHATGLANDSVTVDEFFRLVSDGQKADLLDGVIYMASPDTRRSNRLTNFISTLMENYVAIKDTGGQVFVTRYAFILTDVRAPEPDVAYVAPERTHLIEERGMRGGPDIAAEIVSRDSRTRDYVEKHQAYRDAGVKEYWIIDPLQHRVEFLRLREGSYELVPLEANRIFRSSVLPGFWLDVDWLLADSLPNSYHCLQEILGGPAK